MRVSGLNRNAIDNIYITDTVWSLSGRMIITFGHGVYGKMTVNPARLISPIVYGKPGNTAELAFGAVAALYSSGN